MIARDNTTREQLNTTARARLRADGLLADAGVRIGGREWTVGDRVIARRNDRRLDIDNGTTATITARLGCSPLPTASATAGCRSESWNRSLTLLPRGPTGSLLGRTFFAD